jgi:hypothetical protein
VSTILSLLAFVAYIIVIVGLAASLTWIVVRLTPPQKKPKPGGQAES